MAQAQTCAPGPRDGWLDADALKVISVQEVLDRYELLEGLTQRGPTYSGPSPFSGGGTLSVNTEKNVWNDSWGRPEIEGRIVPGNVIGLVQAIERVPFRRALEILHERFAGGSRSEAETIRAKTATTLRRQSTEARREGNVPFGKELKGLKADVPLLRDAGISPDTAKTWGVGYCSRGLMRGRVAFPIRSTDGTVVAYTGLSTKQEAPEGRWKFPSGFQRGLELFAIDRIHQDEVVRRKAADFGLALAGDPLEALVLQLAGVPAVSPMGPELSEAQLAMLLDPRINPSARLTLGDGPSRRVWATALIRRAWIRFAEPTDNRSS